MKMSCFNFDESNYPEAVNLTRFLADATCSNNWKGNLDFGQFCEPFTITRPIPPKQYFCHIVQYEHVLTNWLYCF